MVCRDRDYNLVCFYGITTLRRLLFLHYKHILKDIITVIMLLETDKGSVLLVKNMYYAEWNYLWWYRVYTLIDVLYIFYNRTTHPRSKIETFHWYLPLHDFVDTVKKEPCMISTFTFYNKCKHVYEKKRAMVILDTYKNITYDMVIINIFIMFYATSMLINLQ